MLDAIAEEMRRDERVVCIGTFSTHLPDLAEEFGLRRIRRTPIAEATVTGIAVGAALAGLRPIAFYKNTAFTFVAFDQIANQAAKLRYMLGGQCDLPIVLRAECGPDRQLGAQHSQNAYSIFTQIPGLKVVLPSSPLDAKALMKAAIRDPNPVLVFEPTSLQSVEGPVGDDGFVAPLGVAEVKCAGTDVTVVAVGQMVPTALGVAQELAERGVSVEVLDPRSLQPLDAGAIRRSVRKTGRLVIADQAPPMCSIAAEVAAAVSEDADAFAALKAPIRRVCGRPVPVPYSPPLERFVFPDARAIETAVSAVLG